MWKDCGNCLCCKNTNYESIFKFNYMPKDVVYISTKKKLGEIVARNHNLLMVIVNGSPCFYRLDEVSPAINNQCIRPGEKVRIKFDIKPGTYGDIEMMDEIIKKAVGKIVTVYKNTGYGKFLDDIPYTNFTTEEFGKSVVFNSLLVKPVREAQSYHKQVFCG